jgi:hypothetical protein
LGLAALAAVTVTGVAAAGAPYERAAIVRKAGSSVLEPRRELAVRVTGLWRSETGKPLRYAGGAARYANGIAFYSDDHPSSLVDVSYAKSLWVTPEKIRKSGLLIACGHDDQKCLSDAAGFLTANSKRSSITIARRIGTQQMPEVVFDIFIIPPSDG